MSTLADAISPITSLIDNFDSGSKKERNALIVKRYLGLDGMGGCSMELAGAPDGLTRESVRQILAKYKQALVAHKASFEGLKRAISILEKISPLSADTAEQTLRDENLIPDDFKIEGVIDTAIYIGLKKNGSDVSIVKEKSCWSKNVCRFVVTTKFEVLPKEIFSKIIKETSHNGASSVVHISNDINASKEIREKFVRDLVSSIPEAQWLDGDKNWFYFSTSGRNRLVPRLAKIFKVYKEAPFTSVKEALRRSINKQNLEIFRRLPDQVLESMFIAEGFTVENGIVSTEKQVVDGKKILEFEQLIVDVISKEPGHTINELKLENAVVKNLKDKYAFSMSLNYSPLVIRLKRGQYSLTGSI